MLMEKSLPAIWIIIALATTYASQIWNRLILTNIYQTVKAIYKCEIREETVSDISRSFSGRIN